MRVRLERVTKRFGNVTAVRDFSAALEDGELACLLGPSGCGKSTLLNLLSGILPVTEGAVFFDDEEVTRLPPDKRGVGLVFQNYALYPHMTVRQNICFPLEIQKIPRQERFRRAEEIARLVHVDALMDRRPGELSGGQQQRVAIARALVKRPRLLLLDEPLSNLDARLRLEMREEIRRIQQETGVTTIFVTHDQEEAMSISDRIILMREGVLQQNDLPQTLYNQPANCFVADFLGNPPINRLEGVWHDGAFSLSDGSFSLKLTPSSQVKEGQAVILSIRPESILASAPEMAAFSCPVSRLYEMGKEEIGYLRFGSAEVRAFLPAELRLKAGDVLPVSLRERGVFLFDAESGGRLL